MTCAKSPASEQMRGFFMYLARGLYGMYKLTINNKLPIQKMKTIFLFSALFVSLSVFGQSGVIQETTQPKGWIIQTDASVYQLIVNRQGEVTPVYYGPKEQFNHRKPNALWNTDNIPEIPYRGGGSDLFKMPRTPLLEVVFDDNVRDCELVFSSAQINELEGRPVLKMIWKDSFYPLEVTSYIKVFAEFDIMEKWTEVKNTGKKGNMRIENLQSASLALPTNDYMLRHMGGYWGNEYVQYDTKLTPGIKTMETKDMRSYNNPSWFAVYPGAEAGEENSRQVWFGQLSYSGNWRMDFNKSPMGGLQISGGINFWDTHWQLKAGESFKTPVMALGFTASGLENASVLMSSYIKKNVLPAARKGKIRPVLYNSWYATEFNVNEEEQLKLARIAKAVGVEMFVVDDGWFKGRNNDKAGLGDWTVDPVKFPNGLNPMIKQINEMGMGFGIWIEPEMVSANSDLYKKHPDWILHFPNRKRNEERNQLVLNLAREDVYQYLLATFTGLLKNHPIAFIKWDRCRAVSEAGWPSANVENQREVRIRFIMNFYKLIDELRNRFPDVLFESCSGGGGRADMGMLERMDQVWISDNTDPVDRLFIQYGYLNAFPANTMVCWTTDEDLHNKQQLPLDFKFDVAMLGVLGIGNNLNKWSVNDIDVAKQKIALYKEIRDEVQNGKAYRLKSPYTSNRMAVEYVSPDRSSVVLCCYNLASYMTGVSAEKRQSDNILFQDLNPAAVYIIKGTKESYTGSFLMSVGIKWPLKDAFKSNIIQMETVR